MVILSLKLLGSIGGGSRSLVKLGGRGNTNNPLLGWIKCLAGVNHYSNSSFKLYEVGVFSPVKTENYDTGQLFLHKLFGYRGVILFPWTANVFDKNDETTASSTTSTTSSSKPPGANNNSTSTTTTTTAAGSPNPESSGTGESKYDRLATDELERSNGGPPERAKAKKLTYYQVLIDTRDLPYIRSLPESVTFLSGPQSNRSVHTIHGLDFVSQHDVLPYTSTDKIPIIHELFERFLKPDVASRTQFSPRDELKAWQEGYHQWLELSDVCICTTQNIRITVIPFYLGVKEDQRKKLYWWRYSIRIENLSHQPVTLKERHWRIFSQAGTFETVKAKGVVGQEPYLTPEQPVFQYSSHVNLQSPSGHMWGTFKMEKEDGTSFEARIPSFYLECKDDDK